MIFTITLSLRQHGTSTAVIGLVQAAIAAGGLLGAVAAPRLQGRMRLATLTIAITVAGALLYCAAALLVPSPLVRRRSPSPAALTGRERGAGRRGAPQRAGGNARPGH